MRIKHSFLQTTTIVQIAIFSALIFIATWINVPIWGANGGLMHLGTLTQTVVALLFGPYVGALSGAIGMTLFDYLSPYAAWAPITFVVRLLAGWIIGQVSPQSAKMKLAIALLLGAFVVIIGYYLGAALLYSDWLTPLPWILGDLVTALVSSIAAVLIAPMVAKGLRPRRDF